VPGRDPLETVRTPAQSRRQLAGAKAVKIGHGTAAWRSAALLDGLQAFGTPVDPLVIGGRRPE
jgi:hypothetical protein